MKPRFLAIVIVLAALPCVAQTPQPPAVWYGPAPWFGGQPMPVQYPATSTNFIHANQFSAVRQYTDTHTGRPRVVRRGMPLFYRRW
jgi:hypothetical protein